MRFHRFTHYLEAQEAIYAGKHTIITGVPASGKSTILMELANSIEFKGHKLILDKLTEEKADLIIRKLNGEEALIFIDTYTDDASAFEKLSNIPSIHVVGADRDYYVSNTMHLISRSRYHVIDITELSDHDLQMIRQSIPDSIRRTEFRRPSMTGATRPSLFEYIQVNIFAPTIYERVQQALREFRYDSPVLAEMLLFVAYVHMCRTPVSMDMALAYWRDQDIKYEKIYEMFKKIGASITEYAGELAEEPQDYFSARSTLVADSVYKAADSKSFRHMLIRFHKNLSPYRICHYRIFSRRAYDDRIAIKAFPDWKEGREFYDYIYERDQSPYVLQQAALYLSKRDSHKEAFNYIDRALAQSGTYNWTIRNSHAIILFKANIGFWQESSARKTLDDSMAILNLCYREDRRKAYHAVVFSDHAVQYWKKYRDETAKTYLEQAREWLDVVREEEPWLKRVEEQQKAVKKQLLTA